MARKLIVTSESALRKKYTDAGWKRIEKAVKRLIAADRARGIETTMIALDAGLASKAAKGNRMASFKIAVDTAFTQAGRPEYLMILGGPDVVPHQDLINPARDEDPIVPSDLPYASEAPAGSETESFVVASRVVGRLPDVVGSNDAAWIVGLLGQAAKWKPLKKGAYGTYFGLSAAEWQKSTSLSLQALFGKNAGPRISPLEGPKWKKADLLPRAHFINCHGAPSDPQFYGQRGRAYPIAHQSTSLPGRVTPGTVVAAECCYGAELYAPPRGGASGICTTYLGEGAVGFLGSTTIAYGPQDSNSSADLICRYFMKSVFAGASIGRALLEARQRFAKEASPISPIDLKTLAQFHLLGDPSLHPIGTDATKAALKATAKRAAKSVAMAFLRAPRVLLESHAVLLSEQLESVRSSDDTPAPRNVAEALASEARKAGLVPVTYARTFEVTRAGNTGGALTLESLSTVRQKRLPTGTKFHLLYAAPAGADSSASLESAAPKSVGATRPGRGEITKRVCLLAREVGGKVTGIERLWAHAFHPNADIAKRI